MWSKIEDGELKTIPKIITEKNSKIIGFTSDFLKERGYKPIIFDQYPSDNDEHTCLYIDEGENIRQIWQ